MSTGSAIPFADAYAIAKEVAAELRPHAVRVKAAGSLRRRRAQVSDLDFVLEPPLVEADLLGTLAPDTDPVRAALEGIGTWVRGADRSMVVTDVLGQTGLRCEVHLAHPPAQWGSILAIRTGPWELGKLAVTRMLERRLKHEGGRVLDTRTGETLPTPDEADFFRLAGLPCWPPAKRDELFERLRRGEAVRG